MEQKMRGDGMNDLIYRQDAIDALSTPHGILYPIRTIEELPSAEPETITAYWKKDAFGAVFCSKCGGIRRDNRVGHVQWCNSCGCFMRGEQDE